ncbi:hypothetical protein B4U79_07107 [Dinothrombium tinctorium]|uniref:Uncharacterized protein n=1 Tax=Dinothrombium tinctorium TaxID=1965070 RepID=A0A3S3QP14_9ACAR|nr:hypothetical protein B4U79_00360 [Dinothrombium tinctorium]RWS11746.1 hypothetical protein B4U79_07107 [Dinothrombium tinctorium]
MMMKTQSYSRFAYTVESQSDDQAESKDSNGHNWGPKNNYGSRKANADYRIIDYISSDYGFSTHAKANEPGMSSSNANDVKVKSNAQYDQQTSESSSKTKGTKGQLQTETMDEFEQKPEKIVEDQESTTQATSTSVPKTNQREVERDNTQYNKSGKDARRPSMGAKLSIHQLISEAMPTLQMSIVPVYFMNKETKSLITVPYLVMKSISKMPLIPGMFSGLNNENNNLANFQHTSNRIRYRAANQLLPYLATPSYSQEYAKTSERNQVESDGDNSWVAVYSGHSTQDALW